MKTAILFIALLTATSVHADAPGGGLTCKETAKLAVRAAMLKDQGFAYRDVMSLVGGADKRLDAAIRDIYVQGLTPTQASNRVLGPCIVDEVNGKGKVK